MKKRTSLLFVALIATSLVSGASAFAETKDEIEIRNAQTRFEEGVVLADQGQVEEARVKFVQAYAVLKSSNVLYNLAIAEKKTNRPVECVAHFRTYLKDPTITPELRTRAEQIVAELSKTTSRIEVSATPGADVRIDGITVGRAPFADPIDVAIGHHSVEAVLQEKKKNAELDTTGGQLARVDVKFPGVAGGPAPHLWTTPRIVGIGMLGAGLIAAGFATGFAVASSKDASQAETLRGTSPENFCNGVTSADCTELDRVVSNRVTEANLALGMGIAAGALVVTGTVLLIMPTPKPKEASIWLVPGFGGASLVGRFEDEMRTVLLGCLGMSVALLAVDCYSASCEETLTCGSPYDAGIKETGFDAPANCDLKKDPKDSLDCIVDSVGIFVSEGGQDTNAGTKASPVKTINEALSIAGGKPRIYVCAGSYPAAVIDKGVSVYGGFDCTTWAPTGAGTLIEAPLNALSVKTPTAITIADLTASAKSGTAAGDSAIAALVATGSDVTFRRVKFLAGDGKPGAAGSENTVVLAQATKGPNANGLSGGVHLNACNCPDGTTTGGSGGNSSSGSGSPGEPLDGGGGAGGQGATGDCTLNSNAGFGKKGALGATLTLGAGATTIGIASDTGWATSKGTDGSNGRRGQGGGGGGGNAGGGGGAGGCGGCGGDKGGGGGGGGASVALLANAATVKLESCELTTGNGGVGGKGGSGQKGQPGGLEGKDAVGPGCNGGAGGNGGDGSAGGGGAGGTTVGILYKGTKPVTDAATDGKITVGTKGTKGLGGATPANDGIDGVAQAVLQAP